MKVRPADLRFITRYDYQGRHGWWVRIQRRLAKKTAPLVISRFFSDEKFGGYESALVKAKAFRDTAAASAPAPRAKSHVPVGVKRGYGYLRIDGDTVKGWYRDSRGKVHRKTLSTLKWSLAEAKKKVEDWLVKKTGTALLPSAWLDSPEALT